MELASQPSIHSIPKATSPSVAFHCCRNHEPFSVPLFLIKATIIFHSTYHSASSASKQARERERDFYYDSPSPRRCPFIHYIWSDKFYQPSMRCRLLERCQLPATERERDRREQSATILREREGSCA